MKKIEEYKPVDGTATPEGKATTFNIDQRFMVSTVFAIEETHHL